MAVLSEAGNKIIWTRIMASDKNSKYPVMTTKRLTLRQPRLEDGDSYHSLLSMPELGQYTNLPRNPTKKRSERLVSWMSKLYGRQSGCAWMIQKRRARSVIGAIRINEIDKKNRCGSIGYELHSDYWNDGLMTEAVEAVTKFAFEHFDLNRVEAWTWPGNEASNRVLLKNGFTHEGTLRQRMFFDGEYHDKNIFGKLVFKQRS